MTLLPKPVRYVDLDYLAEQRELGCVVCPRQPADHAHHIVTRGAGGSDLGALGLCAEHHQEIHQIGTSAFEARHCVRLDRVARDRATAYLLRRVRSLESEVAALRAQLALGHVSGRDEAQDTGLPARNDPGQV